MSNDTMLGHSSPELIPLHALLEQVRALALPPTDYAIFGSGPLLVRNIIPAVNDIDILCRNAAWDRACELGILQHLPAYHVDVVSIDDGLITLGRSWGIGNFDVDELINTADAIDGLPFIRLEHVIAYKRLANRPKDIDHLQRLAARGLLTAVDPGAA